MFIKIHVGLTINSQAKIKIVGSKSTHQLEIKTNR